ncbi:MAG: Rab family GTPase [Promethearchaeota archaeon]
MEWEDWSSEGPRSQTKSVAQTRPEVLKVLLLGEGSVGKTSLIRRYSGEEFQASYVPTLNVDITRFEFQQEGSTGEEVTYQVAFWDLAGQEIFRRLHQHFFTGASGLVFVFDITSPQSLKKVRAWYDDAMSHQLQGIPALLVGNKVDLEWERKVSPQEIQNFSRGLPNINETFETSALTGENVDEMFDRLVALILTGC